MTNYTEEVFDAVGDNAEWINYVAPIIGVNPVAVAAALAEEIYDLSQKSYFCQVGNWGFDYSPA